jgi:hypothetical protein
MDALDGHLHRIRVATERDWRDLLARLTERCQPLEPSPLRRIRPGRVPDAEWQDSPEYLALADMLTHCWPTVTAQRQ